MKYFNLMLLATIIFVTSCQEKKIEEKDVTIEMIDSNDDNPNVDDHNSQNSLDWFGSYEGLIPCADCPGIKLEIELNPDNTYEIEQKYLDKNTKLEDKGTFTWHEDGNSIHINSKNVGHYHLKVGEGKLFILDTEGKLQTGNLADDYVLTKE